MKYKIISEDVIKNLVEFLDDVQSEAAESKNSPEELQKINFCNWAISQLINGTRAYGPLDGEDERPATKDEKWDIIDEYFLDFQLPKDMTRKEINKMMNQFEGFFKGWDKTYKKTKHTTGKKKTLKQFRNNLLRDDELTPHEKFELYYEEYEKNKKIKSKDLNAILKQL